MAGTVMPPHYGPPVVTIVLDLGNTCMCYGCRKKICKVLNRIPGVMEHCCNMETNQIKLTGTVDPDFVVRKVSKVKMHAKLSGVTYKHGNHNGTLPSHGIHNGSLPLHGTHNGALPPHGTHKGCPPPHGSHIGAPPPHGSHTGVPPPHGAHSCGPPSHGTHGCGPPSHRTHNCGPPQHGAHSCGSPSHGTHSCGPPPHETHSCGLPPHRTHSCGPPPHGTHSCAPPQSFFGHEVLQPKSHAPHDNAPMPQGHGVSCRGCKHGQPPSQAKPSHCSVHIHVTDKGQGKPTSYHRSAHPQTTSNKGPPQSKQHLHCSEPPPSSACHCPPPKAPITQAPPPHPKNPATHQPDNFLDGPSSPLIPRNVRNSSILGQLAKIPKLKNVQLIKKKGIKFSFQDGQVKSCHPISHMEVRPAYDHAALPQRQPPCYISPHSHDQLQNTCTIM